MKPVAITLRVMKPVAITLRVMKPVATTLRVMKPPTRTDALWEGLVTRSVTATYSA